MFKKFYLWLREKVVGKELRELRAIKMRLHELEHWCSYDPAIVASARWVQDPSKRTKVGGDLCTSIASFRTHLKRTYTKTRVLEEVDYEEGVR